MNIYLFLYFISVFMLSKYIMIKINIIITQIIHKKCEISIVEKNPNISSLLVSRIKRMIVGLIRV